jgi:hypothetical protein
MNVILAIQSLFSRSWQRDKPALDPALSPPGGRPLQPPGSKKEKAHVDQSFWHVGFGIPSIERF